MNRLVFLIALAFTTYSVTTEAQVPELPEVPIGLADGISAILSEKWAGLSRRLSSAQSAAEKLSQDCTGVVKGTPEAANCRARQSHLIDLRKEYSGDVIAFRDDIRLASGKETGPLKAIRIFGLRTRGTVYIYNDGERTTKSGLFSAKADRIKTGPNSRFEGALPDGTRIIIGPDSDIEISTYFYDLRRNEILLKKIKGVLRSIVPPGGSRFKIRTPKTCVCVRGTDFVIEGSDTGEIGYVAVLEGEVSVESSGHSRPVPILAGKVAYLGDDGTVKSIQDVGETILLRNLLQRYPQLANEDEGS